MKALSVACLLGLTQADIYLDLADYYKKYQNGLSKAIIKAGSNNLSDADIESTTCYLTIQDLNTCVDELADADTGRTFNKFQECQVFISAANRDCNYRGLNQAINSRFKNKSALFGTASDAIVEAGLAAFYAFTDDTAG